jgi:hypothetical protein
VEWTSSRYIWSSAPILFLQEQIKEIIIIIIIAVARVAARPRRPGARSSLPCPVPACGRRGRLAGAGLGSHCGVEFGRSRTGEGSSGGRKRGVV